MYGCTFTPDSQRQHKKAELVINHSIAVRKLMFSINRCTWVFVCINLEMCWMWYTMKPGQKQKTNDMLKLLGRFITNKMLF